MLPTWGGFISGQDATGIPGGCAFDDVLT